MSQELDPSGLAFARFRGAVLEAGMKTTSPEIRDWLESRLGFPPPIQLRDLPVAQLEEFATLLEAKHLQNFRKGTLTNANLHS